MGKDTTCAVVMIKFKASLWHPGRLFRLKTTETERGKGSGSYTHTGAQFTG